MNIDFAHLMNMANENSALIVAIATVMLMIITWLYLRETRKLRLLTQKAISVDFSPRVYIKNIVAEQKPNPPNNTIDIRTCIVIKNCGKTEAKNVKLAYIIKNDKSGVKGTKGPFQYLFPGQESSYYTKFFSIPLGPQHKDTLKEAVNYGHDISLLPLKELFRSIQLDIRVVYEDSDGEKHEIPYSYQFSVRNKTWVYAGMGIE